MLGDPERETLNILCGLAGSSSAICLEKNTAQVETGPMMGKHKVISEPNLQPEAESSPADSYSINEKQIPIISRHQVTELVYSTTIITVS